MYPFNRSTSRLDVILTENLDGKIEALPVETVEELTFNLSVSDVLTNDGNTNFRSDPAELSSSFPTTRPTRLRKSGTSSPREVGSE